MKKIRTLLIAACAITFLGGCKETPVTPPSPQPEKKEPAVFDSLEINELPKTTFYCGEKFSNYGISVKVNLSDGTSFISEDVTTSKPSSMMTPGKQTIKAYYSNDKYDINTWVTYEIEIIDWTPSEKMIFAETSTSTFSGVFYPKMEGMKLNMETDDATGEVTDYWIELENADTKTVTEYLDLLDEYEVKKTVMQNGQSYPVTYKFYEQNSVPSDFLDVYGDELRDPVCYKYCASYEYIDMSYGAVYELNANDMEDTVVVGLSNDNKLIVRYIVNSIALENMFMCEVDERLTFNSIFVGSAYKALKQVLFGYDNDEGQHAIGTLEELAPTGMRFFNMPEIEPDIFLIQDYAAMYPWLHGEDSYCFEIELPATEEEYNDFVESLDGIEDYTKTTKTAKFGGKDVNYKVYTIEDRPYVGNLTIEVSEYIPNGLSYSMTKDGTRQTITSNCFYVYYRFQAPEVFSPTLDEFYRLYDILFGEGNYSKDAYDKYANGGVGGLVRFNQFKQTEAHPTKDEFEVEDEADALQLFVKTVLEGYDCDQTPTAKTMSGIELLEAKYSNDKFEITIYSYFSGNGKYTVEFSINIAQKQ